MIDDEVDLAEGIDFFGVASKLLHGCAHCGQIDNSWDTGEVLEDDTSGFEWNFHVELGSLLPVEDVFDVGS